MTKRLILLQLLIFIVTLAFTQSSLTEDYLADQIMELTNEESPYHLTIFVIPSKVPYDWSTPKNLRKSFFKNYWRSLFNKDLHLLGHAFLELNTPGQDDIFTGMKAVSRKEQKDMILKEDYGLSILGADMTGMLEKASNLAETVELYSQKGKMAFITVLLNHGAARRMQEFFQVFRSGHDSPSEHYGGAYWPRYYGEGSGCTAFAVSFLDLGGDILQEEYDQWKVKVNIPRDLLGGPYNEGNDVKLKEVRKRKQWADETEDYEHFEIFDPNYMYDWIRKHWTDTIIDDLSSRPVKINYSRGILIDARHVPVPIDEPIFMEREKPSVFVK